MPRRTRAIIYINGLPFRRNADGQASSDIGIVGWGGAEYQYPLAARWRLRSGFRPSTTGNIKESSSTRRTPGSIWGRGWLLSRNTEMSLLATASQRWFGQYSFNYDVGDAPGSGASGFFWPAAETAGPSWSDRTYQQQKFLEGSLMVFSLGATLRALFRLHRSTCWWATSSRRRWRTAGTVPGTGRGRARTWRCRGALNRGPERRVPVDGLRKMGGFRSFADAADRPRGPHPHPAGHAAEPGDHGIRVQSPGRVFQPGPRIQRATVRLQTQPHRNALGPAVLVSSFVILDIPLCHARRRQDMAA